MCTTPSSSAYQFGLAIHSLRDPVQNRARGRTNVVDRMVPAGDLAVERVEVLLGQADDDEWED